MIERYVTLKCGTKVSAIGQGTWYMGENPNEEKQEINALKYGIERGMTLIDTAEMYGNGGAERIVGEAIKGQRDHVFIVSKVFPHHSSLTEIEQACERSLQRLGTEAIDLYLLHWRGATAFSEVVEGMERLIKAGKIKRWGVSNLDTDEMEELINVEHGDHCATNQVLYHLGSRGIEFDLLPWQRQNQMPIMAYCPLAQGGRLREQLLKDKTIQQIAEKYDVKPLQIALAWTIRTNDVITIPKAVQLDHIEQNAAASSITFTEDDLLLLDKAFPQPTKKTYLDIV